MNKRFLKLLADFFAPELCAHCREPVGEPGEFCKICNVKWQAEKNRAAIEHHGTPAVYFRTNADGMKQKIEKDVLCLAYYDPNDIDSPARSLVYKLKENATRRTIEFAAQEYVGLLKKAAPELFNGVIPKDEVVTAWIPRRPEAIRAIGYDHMELCARALADLCGFDCDRLLIRSKGALEQKLLSTQGRFDNAERTMSFSGADITGKTILLIDDLVTSGASMLAAESLLTQNGARFVISAVLLATKHDRKHIK